MSKEDTVPNYRIEKVGTGSSAHEVLHLRNTLRAKVRVLPAESAPDPIAAAEAALANISSEFEGWLEADIDRLDAARDSVRGAGLDEVGAKALYAVSHDLRGQAPTLGRPMLAKVAESLCNLIDRVRADRIPFHVIDQHVDTIRAVAHAGVDSRESAIARTLVARLCEVTDEFVATEIARAEHASLPA